jgi:hypothetical protein
MTFLNHGCDTWFQLLLVSNGQQFFLIGVALADYYEINRCLELRGVFPSRSASYLAIAFRFGPIGYFRGLLDAPDKPRALSRRVDPD